MNNRNIFDNYWQVLEIEAAQSEFDRIRSLKAAEEKAIDEKIKMLNNELKEVKQEEISRLSFLKIEIYNLQKARYWLTDYENRLKLFLFEKLLKKKQQDRRDDFEIVLNNIKFLKRALNKSHIQTYTYAQSKSLTVEQEINLINLELADFDYRPGSITNRNDSFRVKFLEKRKKYLELLQAEMKNIKKDKKVSDESHPEDHQDNSLNEAELTKSTAAVKSNPLVQIGKKIIDLADDGFDLIRGAINNAPHALEFFTAIFSGICSSIICAIEARAAFKEFQYSNLLTEADNKQHKTRWATSGVSILLGAGGALAGMLMIVGAAAGGAVATAVGLPLLPFIVVGALTSIYALTVIRTGYIFHRAKQMEEEAFKKYEDAVQERDNHSQELIQQLSTLQQQKIMLQKQLPNFKDPVSILLINNQLKSIEQQIDGLYEKYAKLDAKVQIAKEEYDEKREARLEAERELAFSVSECGSAMFITAGIILVCTTFFAAASIASFGILPTALIVAGVIVGVGAKIFEHFDKKSDHKYTNGIRNFFTNLFSSKKSENSIEMEKVNKKQPEKSIVASLEAHKQPNDKLNDNNSLEQTHTKSVKEEEIGLRLPRDSTTSHLSSGSRSVPRSSSMSSLSSLSDNSEIPSSEHSSPSSSSTLEAAKALHVSPHFLSAAKNDSNLPHLIIPGSEEEIARVSTGSMTPSLVPRDEEDDKNHLSKSLPNHPFTSPGDEDEDNDDKGKRFKKFP